MQNKLYQAAIYAFRSRNGSGLDYSSHSNNNLEL